MILETIPCPVAECGAKLSASAGQVRAHLIDEHGWSKVGAQAAENQARRELGPIAPAPRSTASQTVRCCGICRQPGHRRETCPQRDRAESPGADMPGEKAKAILHKRPTTPNVELGPPATLPAPDPARAALLHVVGTLIDGLREVADRLDELVATGVVQ